MATSSFFEKIIVDRKMADAIIHAFKHPKKVEFKGTRPIKIATREDIKTLFKK